MFSAVDNQTIGDTGYVVEIKICFLVCINLDQHRYIHNVVNHNEIFVYSNNTETCVWIIRAIKIKIKRDMRRWIGRMGPSSILLIYYLVNENHSYNFFKNII